MPALTVPERFVPAVRAGILDQMGQEAESLAATLFDYAFEGSSESEVPPAERLGVIHELKRLLDPSAGGVGWVGRDEEEHEFEMRDYIAERVLEWVRDDARESLPDESDPRPLADLIGWSSDQLDQLKVTA